MAKIRSMHAVEGPGDAQPGAIRLAFASADRRTVDQHFGSATQLLIYRVDAAGSRLVGVAQFGSPAQDGNEDKLQTKLGELAGCAGVYCQAVGPSAVRQLLAEGIQPLRVEPGSTISGLLAETRALLCDPRPPRWIARHLDPEEARLERFRAMNDRGWDEG